MLEQNHMKLNGIYFWVYAHRIALVMTETAHSLTQFGPFVVNKMKGDFFIYTLFKNSSLRCASSIQLYSYSWHWHAPTYLHCVV